MNIKTYRSDNRSTGREYTACQLQVLPDGTAYITFDGPGGTWADMKLSANDVAELLRAVVIRGPDLGLVKCIAA